MLQLPSPLVDVNWLHDNLSVPELIVLDASVPPVVPGYESLNSEENFQAISGARRFDYDKKICKRDSSLPHMMPEEELFQEEVRNLGINTDSVIVIYDDVGLYSSPRAWWMLRAMGHEQVAVLDGGLRAWIAAGFTTVDSLQLDPASGNFEASYGEDAFCDFSVVLSSLDDSSCVILDARSSGRFYGTAPEPRPGIRGGHMPNARNLPFSELLNEGKMKPTAELQEIFNAFITADKRLITSCGSGLTACILTYAAYLAGHRNLSVYDGSWIEWGAPSKLPVVTD
ncbi:MAG: sulfurtransferase [SAR86 cluster bacterium]|uniref:Sulfurtransferase n=1 Tax=SAR86 cluster bacterium TaxID=2030880 RepID=A0A2A4WRE6_9GAMM|nr:MAG: sulfurtransferase [SAR86 cluster bacterium]